MTVDMLSCDVVVSRESMRVYQSKIASSIQSLLPKRLAVIGMLPFPHRLLQWWYALKGSSCPHSALPSAVFLPSLQPTLPDS